MKLMIYLFRSWTNYTGCLDLEDVSFHYTINQVQTFTDTYT